MTTQSTRPSRRSTKVIAVAANLGEPALSLLKSRMKPRAYLQSLVEAGLHVDAIKFMAQALPSREGVWWAWVTAKRAAGGDASAVVEASLKATEKWIAQPSHENAHAAYIKADAADGATPAGMAGLAAFLSGPSMAPPGHDLIPPPVGVSQKLIGGAVSLAAFGDDPTTADDRFLAAIAQGMDAVNKSGLWPE